MTLGAQQNVPPGWNALGYDDSDASKVEVLWREEREVGGYVGLVDARVALESGAGWVDFWRCRWQYGDYETLEHKRLLGDWLNRPRASVVRDVIQLADEWHQYVLRHAALEALAGTLQEIAKDPTSASTGASDLAAWPLTPEPDGTYRVPRRGIAWAGAGRGLVVNNNPPLYGQVSVHQGDVISIAGAASPPAYRPGPTQ